MNDMKLKEKARAVAERLHYPMEKGLTYKMEVIAGAMKDVAEEAVKDNPLLAFKVDHRSSGHCTVHGNFACGWMGDRSPGGCGLCDRERIEKLAAKLALLTATPSDEEEREALEQARSLSGEPGMNNNSTVVLARALRQSKAKIAEMEEAQEKSECGHPSACTEHRQGPEDADEVCLWCEQVMAAGEVAGYEKDATLAALREAREALEYMAAKGVRFEIVEEKARAALATIRALPASDDARHSSSGIELLVPMTIAADALSAHVLSIRNSKMMPMSKALHVSMCSLCAAHFHLEKALNRRS